MTKKNLLATLGAFALLLVLALPSRAVNKSFLKPDATNDAICTVWGSPNLGMACGKTTAPATKLDVAGTVTATAFAGALTGAVTGNADTATALAANPSDCSSNQFANAIAASGNLTCSAVPNAATTASSANTASAIVTRDGSGNFAAGTITAALAGTSSLATSLAGGDANKVPYQSGAGATSFVNAPGANVVFVANSGAPSWTAAPAFSGASLINLPAYVQGAKAKAALLADTPGGAGQSWYCSDCSQTTIAVSTAATPGGVADVANRTAVIQ